MGAFWTPKFITLWVVVVSCTLISIVVFSVFKSYVDAEVKDAGELCSSSWLNFDFVENPPVQTMKSYVFNISNPGEYLAGGEAKLHEKGPYNFNLDLNRKEIVFYDEGKYVNYTLLNFLNFKEDEKCVGCDHVFTEQVTVMNPAYSALLVGATSEATLLMSLSCAPNQLALMKSDPVVAPYCLKSDIGSNNVGKNCMCCVPPVDGFERVGLNDTEYNDSNYSFCSELTNPMGAQAGLLGYIGKYDGAYELSDTAQAFPLSTGTYTNFLRTFSVSELLTGSMSAMMGFLGYAMAAAPAAMGNPVAIETIAGIIESTEDVKEVCYNTNYDFCPQLSVILAEIQAIKVANSMNPMLAAALVTKHIQDIECVGNVPDYKNLISEGGFTEERALELRYLEGLPCRNFAPAIAFGALITANSMADGTCHDGSTAFPCCISTFSLGTTNAKGLGCLRFIDGVIQSRRVYSAEESREENQVTVRHKTACNKHGKLQLFEWFGRSRFDEWFTPATYTFGVTPMPWAEPLVIKGASSAIGVFTEVDVSESRVLTQTVGNGAGKSFLVTDLNDGTVKDDEFSMYATNLLRIRTAEFKKNEDKYGLQTARFQIKGEFTADDAATEESERSGQMPYPNIINLAYSERGKPAVLTNPNFLDVNEAMFTQTNNMKRGYPNGVGGVSLYKTRSDYAYDAPEIEPEQMTKASVESNRDTFESYWNFEPATGLMVTNQVTGMFGLYTMNCNPYIDSFCSVKATSGGDLCYTRLDSDGAPYTTPCSNANVLTPNIQGEKILPVYWNSVSAKPPQSAIDRAVRLLDVRFVFSILVVIFSVLFFCLFVFTIFSWKNSKEAIPMQGTKEPFPPAKNEHGAPTDGEIAMTNVNHDETI